MKKHMFKQVGKISREINRVGMFSRICESINIAPYYLLNWLFNSLKTYLIHSKSDRNWQELPLCIAILQKGSLYRLCSFHFFLCSNCSLYFHEMSSTFLNHFFNGDILFFGLIRVGARRKLLVIKDLSEMKSTKVY